MAIICCSQVHYQDADQKEPELNTLVLDAGISGGGLTHYTTLLTSSSPILLNAVFSTLKLSTFMLNASSIIQFSLGLHPDVTSGFSLFSPD